MGQMFTYICPKCNKTLNFEVGDGMLYPETCENLRDRAIRGKFGKHLKSLLSFHIEYVVDAEMKVYYCEHCHTYSNKPDLSVYSLANFDLSQVCYRSGYDPGFKLRTYPDKSEDTLVEKHEHKCSRCRQTMKEINLDMEKIFCPNCQSQMEESIVGFWD